MLVSVFGKRQISFVKSHFDRVGNLKTFDEILLVPASVWCAARGGHNGTEYALISTSMVYIKFAVSFIIIGTHTHARSGRINSIVSSYSQGSGSKLNCSRMSVQVESQRSAKVD